MPAGAARPRDREDARDQRDRAFEHAPPFCANLIAVELLFPIAEADPEARLQLLYDRLAARFGFDAGARPALAPQARRAARSSTALPHRITISAHLAPSRAGGHAAPRSRARLGLSSRRAALRARPPLPPALRARSGRRTAAPPRLRLCALSGEKRTACGVPLRGLRPALPALPRLPGSARVSRLPPRRGRPARLRKLRTCGFLRAIASATPRTRRGGPAAR